MSEMSEMTEPRNGVGFRSDISFRQMSEMSEGMSEDSAQMGV